MLALKSAVGRRFMTSFFQHFATYILYVQGGNSQNFLGFAEKFVLKTCAHNVDEIDGRRSLL
jgi:hypothetical protein